MLLLVCFALNPYCLSLLIALIHHLAFLRGIFNYTISHTHLVRIEGDDNDLIKYDTLRDLVLFAQFKKHEKHSSRSFIY